MTIGNIVSNPDGYEITRNGKRTMFRLAEHERTILILCGINVSASMLADAFDNAFKSDRTTRIRADRIAHEQLAAALTRMTTQIYFQKEPCHTNPGIEITHERHIYICFESVATKQGKTKR